jgi:CO/xanthine dehydrogenase Mo-binding subunit
MNGLVNLLGARALPDAAPVPGVLEDIPDAIGGGATRNAVALYDLPHQHVIHHVLDDLPARSSTLRALGSHLNTIAIESMIDELAERAGADPVDYRLSITPDPRMAAVIRHAAAMSGWSADDPAGEGRAKGLAFGRYKNKAAYVAVVAEVLVEEAVKVLRAWCAVDAGLVINPGNAASQIEGGLIQAASWTLKEEIRFEEGVVATRSWADYPIMRFSEVPEIEVEFVGDTGQPTLGIGEASIGPAAAAIANAVARALGFRIRALPITRERLMAAMLA